MKKSAPGTTRSALFRYIEQCQATHPWGRFLDAGTGPNSARWMVSLDCRSRTAVTASPAMERKVREAIGDRLAAHDRLVVGNWMDEELLAGEQFDTVLMDYFLGAIEGFSPYWQERCLERFRPVVRDRLYLTGVEPYVPFSANSTDGKLVCEIGRLRDACLLLAGQRPYREYPVQWVLRQLGLAGFQAVAVRHFPINYGARFVNGQLDMCLDRLPLLGSAELAETLARHIETLRVKALAKIDQDGGLRHGADYVVLARRV